MVREEYVTKYLPQFLTQLDDMVYEGQIPANKPKITAGEYIQISLQLKICELLSEIKYELTNPTARPIDFERRKFQGGHQAT